MDQAVTLSSTDSIERSVLIKAPRAKVWHALSNAEAFGEWFGTNLKGQRFAPGQQVRGAMMSCGHEDTTFDAIVEHMEPESRFSFRWHPYAADATRDYATEPRTLVTFTLESHGNSTLVRVIESGFDSLPSARRREAFPMHEQGWDAQLQNIQRYAEGQ